MTPRLFAISTVALAALTGCKTAPVLLPTTGIADVSAQAAAPAAPTWFTSAPRVTNAVPEDGLARVRAVLRIAEAPSLGFQVQAAPSGLPADFSKAALTLFSKTAFTAYDAKVHTREIKVGAFSSNTDASKTGVFEFPPLKPALDYEASLFLKNAVFIDKNLTSTEQLAGSYSRTDLLLKPGYNQLDFDVTVNGNEYLFNVTTSKAGNVVDDRGVVKGDTLTLATGVALNQPGVAAVRVYLSGECYNAGSGRAFLGEVTAPDSWDTFVWNTRKQVVDGFDPALFEGGKKTNQLAGRLTFEAIDGHGQVVGASVLDIGVFGRPMIDVLIR